MDSPRQARLEITIEDSGDVRVLLHGTIRARYVMNVVDELEMLAACVSKATCLGDCCHHRETLINAALEAR